MNPIRLILKKLNIGGAGVATSVTPVIGGDLVTGGASGISITRAYVGSGGLVTGGVGNVNITQTYLGSGGVVTGGDGTETFVPASYQVDLLLLVVLAVVYLKVVLKLAKVAYLHVVVPVLSLNMRHLPKKLHQRNTGSVLPMLLKKQNNEKRNYINTKLKVVY